MKADPQTYTAPEPRDDGQGQHVTGALHVANVVKPPLYEFVNLKSVSGRLTSFWVPVS